MANFIPTWLAEYKKITAEWQTFIENEALGSEASPPQTDYLAEVIHQHRLRYGESILLVNVNGCFIPALSDLDKLPKEVSLTSMQLAYKKHADLIKTHDTFCAQQRQYPFAYLNQEMNLDGWFFYLPEGRKLSIPIHFLNLVSDEARMIATQNLFIMEKNSHAILLNEYFSLSSFRYMENITTIFSVAENAHLEYYKMQQQGESVIHVAHTFMQQFANSKTTLINIAIGSQFSLDELNVALKAPGANCISSGFYYLQQDHQQVANYVAITHEEPRTHSEMIYKGILDKKSCAVFNGHVHIKNNAVKATANQANHHLLLSPLAEAYSQPELEIEADDIQCKHGATTGQLDREALFYLCSRGIDQQTAQAMLLEGFVENIFKNVNHLGIKARIQEMVNCYAAI